MVCSTMTGVGAAGNCPPVPKPNAMGSRAPSGPPMPTHGHAAPSQYGPPSGSGFSPVQQGGVPAHPSGQYPMQQQFPGAQFNSYQPQSQPQPHAQAYAGWSGPPDAVQAGHAAHQQQRAYMPPGMQPQGPQGGYPGYAQPSGAPPSMASLLNPFTMFSSVSQMGALRLRACVWLVAARVASVPVFCAAPGVPFTWQMAPACATFGPKQQISVPPCQHIV